MSEIINHNSFIIFSITLLTIIGFLLFRNGSSPTKIGAILLLGAIFTGTFFFVKPSTGIDGGVEAVMSQIGNDKPVLLEFQSQY